MRFCKNCGRLAADPAMTHCPKCGMVLPPEVVQPDPQPPRPEAGTPLYHRQTPEDGMTTAEYFFMLLVFAIPVVGFLLLLVWSFSSNGEPARRNLSRAYLIRKLIGAVLLTIVALLAAVAVWSLLRTGVTYPATPYYW